MTLRAHPANGAEFWIVTDETGRVYAQGSREMCELVARGEPIFVEQGRLF